MRFISVKGVCQTHCPLYRGISIIVQSQVNVIMRNVVDDQEHDEFECDMFQGICSADIQSYSYRYLLFLSLPIGNISIKEQKDDDGSESGASTNIQQQ